MVSIRAVVIVATIDRAYENVCTMLGDLVVTNLHSIQRIEEKHILSCYKPKT